MTSPLPERYQRYATPAEERPEASADARARQIIDAVDEALAERHTSYRDTSPLPAVGTAPPVAQPGRPPMSRRATDASALMLTGSVLTATVGGAATAVLWASGHADPAVCAIVFGAPAVLVLALGRFVRRMGEAAPEEHHHHYTGPVHQDHTEVHSTTRGVWARTDHRN
ncbi:hypothetical protein [Streptomyces fructofermentans]|uniref:Uncharacterized protein n=1 Tax=Streptomyces fructofermentans TaxID=152141 RepID=A0A918K1F2_9ACTN|nr:hypothetical protein [Streptomyces fructofermentans]GGX42991.1 hypothetical protein GCM10010515_07200 [Streptomyces fructofermentans]